MKYKALLLSSLIALSAHAEQPSLKPENMQAFNNYVDAMLADEKQIFMAGGEASIGDLLMNVSASQAIADYKANELKANKTYKGKYVRVKSVASAIKEGIANKPYIVANGKNQFENIVIYIDPNDDRFLEISKGDKIDLICRGNGVLMESPIFDKCLFPSDYADKALKLLKDDAISSANKGSIPSIKENAMFLVLYLALENDIKNDCLKDKKSCEKKAKEIINNKDFQKNYLENERMENIKIYYNDSFKKLHSFKDLFTLN